MKRWIHAKTYNYDKVIVFDDWTEEDNITVGNAVDGMVYEVWDNYGHDGLKSSEIVQIVVDHLEEVYGLEKGKDFGVADIRKEIKKYDWD